MLWIEQQLDQPLTLDLIAARAGLSPYHFSRLFSARMGRGVVAQVRARRLVRTARHLTQEPDLQLVELALDCGFDSQEAFMRAFKRFFGVAPGRFRSGFAIASLEAQSPMPESLDRGVYVVHLPGVVTVSAFHVAGSSRRFDAAS